jgi:hypothetical protein
MKPLLRRARRSKNIFFNLLQFAYGPSTASGLRYQLIAEATRLHFVPAVACLSLRSPPLRFAPSSIIHN